MFSLLFDRQFWIGIFLVLIIVGIIIVYAKYQGARKPIISIVCLVMLGFSTYCGIQLNYYYSAEGGIYGKLSGIIQSNTVEEYEEVKFSLKNIVLAQDVNGEYSAIILSDKQVDFKSTDGKHIFVNGIPCSDNRATVNGITANYHYVFKDSDLVKVCEDTLNISFSYYENGYRLKISTKGEQTAVNYWNAYFSRNNFVISIEDLFHSNTENFEVVEGQIQNPVTLTYYVDEQVYSTATYSKGTIVRNLIEIEKEGYTFLGWSADKTNIIEDFTINQDYRLYAVFVKEVLFELNENVGAVEINTNVINDICQIDLNEYFDFKFPKNVTISFELLAENENIQGKYFAYYGEISTGQSRDCIRADYNIHFATITLAENGVIKIAKGENVPQLNNVQLLINSVISF